MCKNCFYFGKGGRLCKCDKDSGCCSRRCYLEPCKFPDCENSYRKPGGMYCINHYTKDIEIVDSPNCSSYMCRNMKRQGDLFCSNKCRDSSLTCCLPGCGKRVKFGTFHCKTSYTSPEGIIRYTECLGYGEEKARRGRLRAQNICAENGCINIKKSQSHFCSDKCEESNVFVGKKMEIDIEDGAKDFVEKVLDSFEE